MAIGKCAASHDLSAKLQLPIGQWSGGSLSSAVQILAEIERIASFVRLAVIINEDDSDIPNFRLKRLDDKGEGVAGHAHLVVKRLNAGKDMHTNAGIFAIMLEHHPLVPMFQVKGRNLEQALRIIDGKGVRWEIITENPSLKDLGSACQLSDGRRDQVDAPGEEVGEEVLFGRLKSKPTDDDVVFDELLVGLKKCLIVADYGGSISQKIISENL